MMTATREEALAELILSDLRKRERLLETARQPAFRFYLGGGMVRTVWSGVVTVGLLALAVKASIPGWGIATAGLAVLGWLETVRLHGRLDALLDLAELEKRAQVSLRYEPGAPGPK